MSYFLDALFSTSVVVRSCIIFRLFVFPKDSNFKHTHTSLSRIDNIMMKEIQVFICFFFFLELCVAKNHVMKLRLVALSSEHSISPQQQKKSFWFFHFLIISQWRLFKSQFPVKCNALHVFNSLLEHKSKNNYSLTLFVAFEEMHTRVWKCCFQPTNRSYKYLWPRWRYRLLRADWIF